MTRLISIAWVLAGCGGGSSPSTPCPTLVVVPMGEVRLAVGASAVRSAVDADEGTPHEAVHWRVDDEEVATVSGAGEVLGRAAGSTRLVVFNGCGEEASQPLRVTDRIVIEPATLSLEVGQTAPLVARGGDGTEVTSLASWSLPVQMAPACWHMRASPDMPQPPMPTKWMRRSLSLSPAVGDG